jgi:diguanylate cyclase (GGDEF)-like protein
MHAPAERCHSCGQPIGHWTTDRLTGLLNRWGWEEATNRLWVSACEQRAQLALLFIDVDRFRCINDSAGHIAGDAVLQAVAGALRTAIRDRDIIVGRYGDHGGDEFLVLLQGDLQDAAVLAGEIKDEIRSTSVSATTRARKTTTITNLTVSIGIAAGRPGCDLLLFSDLLLNADIALHQAKKQGCDHVRM